MGIRAPRTIYRFVIDEGAYAGVVVRARSVSMGKLLSVVKASGGDATNINPDEVEGIFQILADSIVEWNLEDEEGKPLPCTLGSLMDQEPGFISTILGSWVEALGGVGIPLAQQSTTGLECLADIPAITTL